MSKATSLTLRGALTIARGQAQRELLFAALQEPAPDLSLDLSGVEAFDEVGLELLLVTRRHLAARGGRLMLHGAPDVVMSVLARHRLEQLMQAAAEDGPHPTPPGERDNALDVS